MRHAHPVGRWKGRPTVLALRALGLGDLLTSVPALRGLRRSHPDHELVLATSAPLRPLAEMIEAVDEILEVEELGPIPVQMDGDDLAVNLHGRGPDSTRRLLETQPYALISFFHPDVPATYHAPQWLRGEHDTKRWCRLLRQYGVAAEPTDLGLAPVDDSPPDDDLVVIHPGASSSERIWPAARWSSVARVLQRRGKEVMVTGTRPEMHLATQVAEGAGLRTSSVMAGQLDTADLADLVAHAGILLSSDTGPAHLASAFGTPSVILFGPGSFAEWAPPDSDLHLAIRREPGSRPPGGPAGILDITVEDVVAAIDELTGRSRHSAVPGGDSTRERDGGSAVTT